MSSIRKWLFLFVVFSLVGMTSCHRKEKDELCLESALERYSMTKYQGEEIGCRMFLTMYEFRGKLYFELNNHCADMEIFITDCGGNKINETRSDSFNFLFEMNARRIGVVGIE